MKPTEQKGFSVLELLLILITLAVIGLAAFWVNKNRPAQSTPIHTTKASLNQPAIPSNHAYLGAFVNPLHITINIKKVSNAVPGSNVIQQLPAFRSLVGKPVGILHFYMPFNVPLPVSTLNTIEADHSIPLISWGCTDVAAIANGKYDTYISDYANSLKSFGKPVFLRWYWEMNQINKGGGQPAGADCGGYNNGPAFVAAWKHIYTIFHNVGASNVAFVWCPGYSGGNFSTYYPGDNYVDWIGLDRYERTSKGQPFLDFNAMFGNYAQEWASSRKPIMIAETGAMGGGEQSEYFNDVLNQAPQIPQIKAFVYFDSTGPAGDWELESAGIPAFQKLAQSPYFTN